MSWDFLRYLAKGGSLLGCSFGGSITVASLGVTEGSAGKWENLSSWSLLYLHFLLSDEKHRIEILSFSA